MATTRGGLPEANAERIAHVIEVVEKQMQNAEIKATISDYIRLLQMQSEFDKTKPRNIEVRWIDLASNGSNAT